jgi:inhibitor of cysteine peptidase
MRLLLLALLAVAPSFVTSAAEAAWPAAVVVTAADQGRPIELKPGQALRVGLESNRTTGYAWSLGQIDAAVIALLGKPVYTRSAAAARMVGAGGTETWRFRAAATGERQLQFLYRRPFEPNAPPARTVSFMVRVRP